jgi:hypothetical protein
MHLRFSGLLPALGFSGALAAACSSTTSERPAPPADAGADAGEAPPPARCKAPAALPGAGMFKDVTDEVGLAGVVGVRATAVDLDGDGWTDLVIHGYGNGRDAPPNTYMKRVFMNRGGRFVDATAESGFLDSRDGPGTGRMSHLMVFGDIDNDGDVDAFDGVYQDGTATGPAAKDVSEIWLNDGKGHFTMAPATAVSAAKLPTSGASFADYDRDGLLDLFVGTFYAQNAIDGAGNRLYKGAGDGSFEDVSAASKLLRPNINGDPAKYLAGEYRRPAYGVTACDVDNDGDVDFLVSSYGRGWNELWLNEGGVFREIAQGTPFSADDNVSYKSDNEFYHCWCSKQPSGTCPPEESVSKIDCSRYSWEPGFDDQPARMGGNTFTTACADLDNDGVMDFVHATIVHWHIGQSSDPSQIVKNKLVDGRPTFSRVPGLARAHTRADWNDGDMDVAVFDFDGDGKKDIYLSSSDYPDTWGTLWQQQGDGTFKDVTDAAGVKHYHAHGLAVFDLDHDGDLDLVVTTSPARCGGDPKCPTTPALRVYRNEVGHLRNFTQLRLVGGGAGKANASAIGARVAVTAGGVTQVQEVSGGYGHFGMQHDLWLTFGLGDACQIDKIEVKWPDAQGTVETFTGVVANYRVELTQGDERVVYVKEK